MHDLNDLLQQLASHISERKGQSVTFHNGCWLSLNAEEGFYWGVTPYGVDWACNASEDAEVAIRRWIDFWNDSRNEGGALISVASSDISIKVHH